MSRYPDEISDPHENFVPVVGLAVPRWRACLGFRGLRSYRDRRPAPRAREIKALVAALNALIIIFDLMRDRLVVQVIISFRPGIGLSDL
jgi:hypothetical protein